MKEIQKKKDNDLKKLLLEKREELREYRFGATGSKASNTNLGNQIKKDVARILTEINARAQK
ncbi:MAG: 50S ribosomal protein L29 [Candidatus Campbellbacteria bacterium]|nr:50S ribosomal protein L29 [Candidatus Campbellbacteria bacterium]